MKRTKKLFALIMSCAMLMSLLPTTALAEEDAAEDATEEIAEETEIQAADLEIAEDGTATIVIGDAEEESEEDEALAELPVEAVPNDAAEAEDADVAEEAEEAEEAEDAEEAEPEEVIYTAVKDAVSVKVTAPYGALPEGAELSVTRYAKDSDEYGDAAKAIGFEENAGTDMAALDISFLVQGEEVEPAAPVKVSIDVSDILPDSADAGSLEVQHLVETPDEDIEAVVVANESGATEGKIDEANATAEFEVESFSTFTVTWDESVATEGAETITVHVYNINGTSIDEELDEFETYYSTNGVITISDLITHLHQNAEYDSIYTFQYATVYYETEQDIGASYDPHTIGGEEDSVTSISKSADGEIYTVIYGDSDTSETVEDPYIITIHLYYSLPSVTLDTEDPQGDTVVFTTTPEYFQGNTEDATYHWALTDDDLGTITSDDNGGAIFAWNTDVAQVGDQVTVEVTMTVTYTDTEGAEQTETASATYTLTYGTEAVTITVMDADGDIVNGAHVALCTTAEDGSYTTVTTGVTGEDGTVILYAEPGDYIVGVTYAEVASTAGGGSTSRYSGEGTVTVNEEGTGTATVVLGEAITSGPGGNTNGSYNGGEAPYYYEHIDVKIAVAGTEDASATFSDLDAVYVYDKYGNLIYWSDDLIENEGTTDYNCAFDMNGAEDIHSIVVSSEDSIVLVYEVIEDGEYKTYTIRVNADSYYPDGEYYSYTDVNAWQLCNSIYGTEITQDEWNTAVENGEDAVAALFEGVLGDQYNANGISISGLSYIQVADYLCDTRTTNGQAGLDIAIDVGAMSVLAQEYDLQIAKSLQNVPESFDAGSLEVFNFNLTELISVTAGEVDEEVWSTATDNVAGTPLTGSTSDWTDEGDGSWSSIIDFQDFISYEAEENTVFYYYILSEDEAETATADVQYYGIEVAVTFSSTTGTASVVASYCELTQSENDEDTYIRTSTWSGLMAQTGYDYDEEGNVTDTYTYYSVPFINTYDAYIDISGTKTWVNDSEEDRPESITVHLFADGEEVDSVEVTADDNWEWKFGNLPQYQTDGVTEIEYTVLEGVITDPSYIPTYAYETDEEGNVIVTITNALPTVEKDVSDPAYGESTDDNLHQDEADNNDTLEYKMEADHIGGAHDLVLHDFLDDQLDIDTLAIKSVTLYADENDEGKVLEEGTDYTLYTGECSAECGLDGCSFEIQIIDEDVEDLTSDAFVIVIFDIEVHEGVENFDENDVDEIDNFVGLSFTVNGVATYAEPDETETYSYGFDLYKYDADTSEPLAGVEFVLSKAGDDGTVYAQFDVTDETYLLTGWTESENNATPIVTGSDGKAVVEGLHDGTFSIEETKAPEGYQQKAGTMTVTITVDENDPDNPTITATNADVDGLEVQIDNTPGEEDTVELIGSKTWVDGNDKDGVRPDSITIHLFADGEEADSATVTADDNWAWSFKNMPKYQDDGTTEIVYTITEDEIDDYDTTVDGLNVTNTHEPEPQNPVKSVDTDGDGDFDNDGDEVEYLDTLTYKIEYYNHNTTAATVTITDELDDALEFVSASDGGVYDEDTRTITWNIENAAPTSWGSVTFTAEVNEEGLEGIVIENTASVQIGNDAAVDTNTVENPTEEGELTESPVPESGAPKTGDTSHPVTWLLMLLASIMAIGAALALRKQSRR